MRIFTSSGSRQSASTAAEEAPFSAKKKNSPGGAAEAGGPARPRALYSDFFAEYYDINQSVEASARATIFSRFNLQLAPKLVCEESFFQLVAFKLAQLWLVEGQKVHCHVEGRLDGRAALAWAEVNRIGAITFDRTRGGLSFCLDPDGPTGHGARAICFPGTAPAYRRDVLAGQSYPHGFRDDVGWHGVGHEGFAAHRRAWMAQVRAATAVGREVLLVGHSLGAAYASQLFAATQDELGESEAKRVSLLSLHPPGLPRQLLRAMRAHKDRVRLVLHAMDVVSWCGGGHPAGSHLRVSDMIGTTVVPWQPPHAVPHLALRRLLGQAPKATLVDQPRVKWHVLLTPAELARCAGGLLVPLLRLPAALRAGRASGAPGVPGVPDELDPQLSAPACWGRAEPAEPGCYGISSPSADRPTPSPPPAR